MRAVFRIVEALFAFQLDHYGQHRPDDDVVRDFYGHAQVLEPTFINMVGAKQLGAAKGTLARLESGAVHYTDGDGAAEASLPCDLLLCATGFSKDYSYLPPADAAALDVQDGLYLYRHIFPPGVADLAFCGAEVSTISNIGTHAIHAEYIARVVAGELALPPAVPKFNWYIWYKNMSLHEKI